jgi:DNA repair protein RecN (Recombination protein N)
VIELLRVRDLALVEEATLEFGPGLNVLTGETGAGKSIVLGAISLLAGARADPDVVRTGAREAVVEAVFSTLALTDLEAALALRGVETDEHALVVRRTVSGGRSRAQLAGQLVPVSVLGELFGGRLEISSQHESQALLRPETHGRLLDAFGGLLGARETLAEHYAALRRLDDEIARLRAAAEERARQQDFLAWQVREIDAAALLPGEIQSLSADRARLLHAARLAEDSAHALRLVGGEDDADAAPARDRVAEAARRVEAAARLDPGLESMATRLRGLAAELDDVARELSRYGASLDADPERAAVVEERLERLDRLRRKYGETEGEILVFRERAAAELAGITGTEARIDALLVERDAARTRLASEAERLSRGRRAAAKRLATALEEALAALAMPGARFEIALEPAAFAADLPCGPRGAEEPELRLCANAGEPARALRRVASGGELSRVFLALKNVLRGAGAGMVLVFDEVDAGIGGAVADRVGRALAELASVHQVLCITHLPQIAARASTHFRVSKRDVDGRTRTHVERLSAAERVDEIARMAGGETISEATRRHARALLGEAATPAAEPRARRARPGAPPG